MTRIALQLYTVRKELDVDPVGVLRRVREAGFSYVETAGIPPGMTAAEFGRQILASGLEVVSLHAVLPQRAEFSEALELAEATNCRRVIWHGWPRDARFDSRRGVHELARTFAEASEQAAKHQLQFGLHTHWWEFEPLEGEYPYRVFARILPPGVYFQLDVYWLRVAGLNPADVIEELDPRIVTLHAKDGPAIHG